MIKNKVYLMIFATLLSALLVSSCTTFDNMPKSVKSPDFSKEKRKVYANKQVVLIIGDDYFPEIDLRIVYLCENERVYSYALHAENLSPKSPLIGVSCNDYAKAYLGFGSPKPANPDEKKVQNK